MSKNIFNTFLNTNPFVNKYDYLKTKVSEYARQHRLFLWILLLIGSVVTTFIVFLTSIIQYSASLSGVLTFIIQFALCTLVNNFVFAFFVLRVRNQKMSQEYLKIFFQTSYLQFICAFAITVIQTVTLRLVVNVALISQTIYLFLSLCVSLICTLANAIVAFHIIDGEKKILHILQNAFSLLMKNWKELFFLSLIFISWSYFASLIYSGYVIPDYQPVINTNNVFLNLMAAKQYGLLQTTLLFHLLNFAIGAFLEIKPLLSVAYLYDQSRKY